MDLSRETVAVLGCGVSGRAAALLARRAGASVTVLDSGAGDALEAHAEALRAAGCAVVLGDAGTQMEQKFSLVVTSPGIDPSWPLLGQFLERGMRTVSELEFGAWFTQAPTIAITGTNGKTTTAGLVEAILQYNGVRTVACANYGLPLSAIAASDRRYDILTAEVSSFQLELIESFRPRVAVWLNFGADHLDRHPTLEAYRAAKLRIFENQGAGDTAIVRAGESFVSTLAADTITFSAEEDVAARYMLEGATITFDGEPIFAMGEGKLRGRHNAENLMAAFATGRACGVSFADMVEPAKSFAPQRHRCELVGTVDGVEYINDSKSTNLHALESALRAFDGRIILIAGGKDKGLDYAPLAEVVAQRAARVFTVGEIAGQLVDIWGGHIPCQSTHDLDAAVQAAAATATPGDAVLFSPGTSSFDMFRSYAERGEAFCDAVNRLNQKMNNHTKP